MTAAGGPYGPPPPPPSAPPPGATLSADGRYWWDGSRWNPVPPQAAPVVPAGAQLSPDGRYWWDGTRWAPVPPPLAAPPAPVAPVQPWAAAPQLPAPSPVPMAYPGATPVPMAAPRPASARGSGARWVAVGVVVVVVLAAAIGVYLATRPSGLASETPNQIVQAAMTAVNNTSGFEASATGNFGHGVTSFDFKVHGSDVDGTATLNGNVIDLDVIGGNVYFKAPAVFWTAEGLSAANAAQFATAWVEAPAGSSTASDFSGLSSLTDVSSTLENHGALAAGGTGTVDGQAVVFVKDTTNGGTLAVATSGPAYPVQLSQTSGSATGVLTFSNWNAVAAFTLPPSPITIPSS